MKIGVTGMTYNLTVSLPESMARIKAAGYDSVDFNLYDFSFEDGPMTKPDWKKWVESVGHMAKENGLIIGQIHSPYKCLHIPDLDAQIPQDMFFKHIEACAMLDSTEMVIHPIYMNGTLDTPEQRRRLVDYNLNWFRRLIPTAVSCGVYLDMENLFDIRPQSQEVYFSDAPEMIEIADLLGSEMIGFCLDTGHANTMERDIPAMIRALGSRLRVLHLDDNYGPIRPIFPDLHLFPGDGAIDFEAVFAALYENGYKGIMNIEPGDSMLRMPLPVRDACMKGGLEMTKRFAELAGFN